MTAFSRRTAWPRAQNAISLALAARRSRGEPVLDLTASNPTTAFTDLGTADAFAQLSSSGVRTYAPEPFGLDAARAAVSGYYADLGVSVDPSRVVLTASTSEAYGWLFKLLCDPGDRVLVARPSYPLFDDLARLEGVTLDPFPLERDARWSIDLDALVRAIRPETRAIALVHPNNPTGTYARRDEVDALRDIADKHRLALIADEVFLDYPWREDPSRFGSFAAISDALTFTLSGLSKVAAAPQVKLGWIVVGGPDALRHEALARLELVADCYLSVGAPAQHALPALLARRGAAQAVIRARVERNLRALDAALGADSPITRAHADGGWYATLRVPRTRAEEAWALALLEDDGVLVQPGWFYDFAEEAWLVVSLLTEEGVFREGITRLARRVAAG